MNNLSIWFQLLCKKYATYKLFRLNDCGTSKYGVESQGMDVYDNKYIFQGSDQGGKIASIVVIDIANKKIIGEMKLNVEGCHMNNINLGQKFRSDDKFPLLYISECKNKHRCYVVRVSNDLSEANIIQTISFSSNNHYGKTKNAFDWFVSDKYIYTFGMTDVKGEMEIIKFPLPSVHIETVKYTDNDIIGSFKINNCYTYQGTKLIGDKLYALFGLDTEECPTYLKIIDMKRGRIENSINIKGLSELEALGKYEDGFIVVNCAYNPTYTFLKLKQ